MFLIESTIIIKGRGQGKCLYVKNNYTHYIPLQQAADRLENHLIYKFTIAENFGLKSRIVVLILKKGCNVFLSWLHAKWEGYCAGAGW